MRGDLEYGIFAPLAEFMKEISAHLSRINDSLLEVEEALWHIHSDLKKGPSYEDLD